MNKGEVVKFIDLQVGDYFSDNARQKCRKIPEFTLEFPNIPPTTFNAYHIQTHASIFLNSDDEFIFISHSDWVEKRGIELSIEESELEHQLDFFTNYFELLSSSLHIETDNDPNDFYDDETFSSQEVYEFVGLMRSSFFTSLYSYLETRLNNECRSSQQADPNMKISLDDVHGTGINRAKTYLVKVLDTSFSFENNPYWEQIKWYNKIRNCIVHNDGKVIDKELKKYIESQDNLECDLAFGDNYIILGEGFCENAIAVIGAFLRSLMYHREADKVS